MTTNKPKILVVDDERGMRDFLSILLRSEGYAVECVSSGGAAKEIINQPFFDLIITDIKMPDMSGIDLLEYIRGYYSWETAVIMITAYSSTQTAIKALKLGAYDYMCKPFDVEEFKLVVRNALERRRLMQENIYLKKELRIRHDFSNIIGNSSKMLDLFDLIKRVADTGSTMLIVGESGTGKELVAKAIHFQSRRRDKNFVSINCGAMPENLLESELFGHVKGAFTGAIGNKHGLFEVADGGTLLLDEIGDMSPAMQVKLLRVLQDKKIRRVGGTEEVQVDARILAATNKDLRKLVEKGTFREDLYYRINVIEIQIPPLRERREDIPLLWRNAPISWGRRCAGSPGMR
jgi:DNA-binding NtrC family response regulator